MSGIYGYIEKVHTDQCERLEVLDFWHKEYGKSGKVEKVFSSAAIGSRINSIRVDHHMESEVLCLEERYYGVFDALIYNREELINILMNCGVGENSLQLISDERLLFFMFLYAGGENGLCHVNGDFSGAIYDIKDNKLTLFRDHLGVRPLYIYEDESIISFATDYRGLLAIPDAKVDIHEGYFYAKMKGYSIRDVELTFFSHISSVPPAYIISFSGEDLQCNRIQYWKVGEKKIHFSSDAEYISAMRYLVKDAIERRLRINESFVGGELSGGLDSTVIAVLIRKFGIKAHFCSLSPDIDKVPLQALDEREDIIKICKKFDLQCHFMTLKGHEEEHIINDLESILPADDGQGIMEEMMLQFKEQGVATVFSGWGGDEGISHRANPMELWKNKEFGAYLKFWWNSTENEKMRLGRTVKRVFVNLFELKRRMKGWDYYSANKVEEIDFINKEFAKKIANDITTLPVYFSFDPKKHIENGGNRHRTETVAVYSARQDVQYLFPYLDYRVVDYALSIPRRLYLKGKKNRYIYREAFREDMTEELYCLQRKNEPIHGKYIQQNMSKRFRIVSEHVLNELDKIYWSKYLDFEQIKVMIAKEKKGELDYPVMIQLIRCLTNCYRIQSLQTKIRKNDEN